MGALIYLPPLVTFASVFFFVMVLVAVLRAAYDKYQERYAVQDLSDPAELVLFIDAKSLLVVSITTSFMAMSVAIIFFGWVATLIMSTAGFAAPMIYVKWYRAKRLRTFNAQLVDALQAMANAFKAGLTFPQAIEYISKEAQNPLGQEFKIFVKELKLGVPIEDGLINMAGRMKSDDLELVVTSTNIARQLGGNMAEMFETISATIRERFRLEGKIDAMVSQGKMQGWVVAMMPLLLGMVLNIMRPDLMEPMLNHPFGVVMVVLIMISEAMGVFIIRKIINIDI